MKKITKELILITFLSILFILLTILTINNQIYSIDNLIHSYILSIRNNNLTNTMNIITNLGGATCLLATSSILLIIKNNKKIGINLFLHLILGFIINQLTKHIFVRPRPIGINLINESGYSYPSGHSMISLIFYGYIIYLIFKSNLNKFIKSIIITLLIILILLIGFSRIYLGVHYFTDVIGGFLLALIYLLSIKNIKLEKK